MDEYDHSSDRGKYMENLEIARMQIANHKVTAYSKIKGVVLGDMPLNYYGFTDVKSAIRFFVDECESKCAESMDKFRLDNPPPEGRNGNRG